jgi:hypothetical protein
MTDPFFWIATAGLVISGIVSATKLIDWFLHNDPRVIANAGRWAVIGLFPLSIPLLIWLVAKEQWAAVVGLSAVLLLAFAFYGPRALRRMFPRRLYADWGEPANGYAERPTAANDTEMIKRSIAVLEEYLRRTARMSNAERAEQHSRAQISHAADRRNGGAAEFGTRTMSEAEALEVLGLGADAEESEINESHRRLMQLIHPDRGGSAYFAVKVNQAKDILLGRADIKEHRGTSTRTRKRRRTPNRHDVSQSKSAAGE